MSKKVEKKSKIYVVNYKETHMCCGSVVQTISGVCPEGFTDVKSAVAKCWELSDNIMNKYVDVVEEEHLYRDTSRKGDWQEVTVDEDKFEYWVTIVKVPNTDDGSKGKVEDIRKILNDEDMCAEAMVSEIGELVG